jgi:hypothetical protein
MEFTRLPRFKRSGAIAAIRLTERDRDILRMVHRHRFLRSDHITSLLLGSPQQILRRLQRLYHHGYLERPRCQIDYYQHGSRCMAYGLGRKGAALLKRQLSLPYPRLTQGQHGPVGRLFLTHALLVSDVMVALELACRRQHSMRLLMPDEVELPRNAGRRYDQFKWTVNLGNGSRIGVVPDRAFALESAAGSGARCWFFLEADRGTMPVTRANLNQTSFCRKLLAYQATWTQGVHRTRFGCDRFRVLTVTTNAARISSMLRAARSLARGHGLFLFTDAATLRSAPNFFALRWRTCRPGETARLLD